MSRFKVGDEIRIAKITNRLSPDYLGFTGKVIEVLLSPCSQDYIVEVNGPLEEIVILSVYEEEIEPANPEKVFKFDLESRVEVIGTGDAGTIVSTQDRPRNRFDYGVKLDYKQTTSIGVINYFAENELESERVPVPAPYRKPDDEKVAATVQRILDADSQFELNYKLKRIASLLATNGYLSEN